MNEFGFNKNPDENDINELFQELISHGSPLFGISVYKTVHDSTRNIMIHKHWHPEWEILYLEKNELIIEIDSQKFYAKEGDILFIPSNLLHSALQENHLGATFYAVVFDPSFISSYGMDIIQQEYLEPIKQYPEEYIKIFKTTDRYYTNVHTTLINIISSYKNRQKGYELFIKGNLYNFIYSLIHSSLDTTYIPKKKQSDIITSLRIKQILTYIEANYQEKIYLKDLADELSLSQQYFCRFFKKHFHMSFNHYLTQYRINRAELLLQKTELPIIDVAVEVGFESANYFTIVFKEVLGDTPSNYRKKKRS